ncbi:MAG: hypothetical protein H6744_17615 [Deltaproteobacteria bacterium]|nr:hypothetical protein [Deltaproteobacteria bacterium]
MTSRHHIVVAASCVAFWLGACADIDRGEKPPPPPDVTAPDVSGPGDVAGDLTADTATDPGGDPGTDPGMDGPEEVAQGEYSFAADVHPILQNLCGQCHTSGAPRAFFLSSNPADDYPNIVKLVKIDDPPASKLLLKGTGESQHGGGSPISAGTADYGTIIDWIAEGAFP